MKNNFRNCLIFRENKLFSTNFRKHNNTLYYNYKIIIYSQALHEFATIYIKRSMESQSSQTDDKWEDIEMKGVKTICSCNHVLPLR